MKEVIKMGKQKRYSSEFKQMAVQNYLQGDLSANEIATDLGVHPHTIRHWIQDYNDGKTKNTKAVCDENKDCYATLTVTETKTETNNQSEIKAIFFRISSMEKEVEDLKTLLLAYLIK